MDSRQSGKTWSTPVTEEARLPIPCAVCGGEYFKPSLVCEGFSYVKCVSCGLVQINPQPLPSDVQKRYGDAHGDDYLAYELKNEDAFLELQKLALTDVGFYQIEQALFSSPSSSSLRASVSPCEVFSNKPSVLDIGCATGALLDFLRSRGWQASGVEISPSAEYARNQRNLDVRSESLENCHFPDESFDVVLASHLIEHLNSPQTLVSEAWRILKPSAYLILTTPNISGFQARLMGGRWRSAIFDHLYLFSVRTIKTMLKAHGFITEGVYTWGGLAAGIAPQPIKALADKMAKALGWGDVMVVRAKKGIS